MLGLFPLLFCDYVQKRFRLTRRAREAAKNEKMLEAEERTDNWLRERREEELRHKTVRIDLA